MEPWPQIVYSSFGTLRANLDYMKKCTIGQEFLPKTRLYEPTVGKPHKMGKTLKKN